MLFLLRGMHGYEKRGESVKKEKSILQLFPGQMRPYFEQVSGRHEDLEEIRIRVGKPVIIHRCGREYYLTEKGEEKLAEGNLWEDALCFAGGQVDHMFSYLCQYSPYAYSEALKQGFLTVAGGHRVGVAGQVIRTSEGIGGIRNVRFLNIRISHEVKGVAEPVAAHLYEERTGIIHNCLIVAPPGLGKTTLLRDLVRVVSNGNEICKGLRVAVVDERSEIAGCFQGEPQNDVGPRTDVLDGCPKAFGMEMMLRSMSPEVLAVDEIALSEDVETLLLLLNCGVRVIATVHGESFARVMEKPFLKPLFETTYFKRFLLMKEKGKVEIFNEKGERML